MRLLQAQGWRKVTADTGSEGIVAADKYAPVLQPYTAALLQCGFVCAVSRQCLSRAGGGYLA